MRTLILITAMVLASATAQAGDSRGLSTGMITDTPAERPAPPAPSAVRAENAPATDAPRYAPPPASTTTTPSDPQRNVSDTPRYNTRPAPVDPAPATTATTPPATPSTAYRDTPRSEPSYHPSPSRMRYRPAAHMNQRYAAIRWPRPHVPHRWSTRRVIAALHRYGIYW
jgi:hypothetical protein